MDILARKIARRFQAGPKKLTDAEFNRIQDKIDAELRKTKRNTPERAEHERKAQPWEDAFAMPQGTQRQREERWEALYEAGQAWV